MSLTVDMPLTEEVRAHLATVGKMVVFKEPTLRPTLDAERRSIRSQMREEYEWVEGWNYAEQKIWWSKPSFSHGTELGARVLHAYFKKPQEDEKYMALEAFDKHFVAAGLMGGNQIQLAFTALYLPAFERERLAKMPASGPSYRTVSFGTPSFQLLNTYTAPLGIVTRSPDASFVSCDASKDESDES